MFVSDRLPQSLTYLTVGVYGMDFTQVAFKELQMLVLMCLLHIVVDEVFFFLVFF